jgi:hypothetical protein
VFLDASLAIDKQDPRSEPFDLIANAGNHPLAENDPGWILEYEILHGVTPEIRYPK